MRLLHTSDWHLGQTLHQFDRTQEHADFLAWLLNTLEQQQIDVLLVAGDLFDTANPSAAAQRQLYEFLTAARKRIAHLTIVLIAGNHDSPGRVEAPAPFLQLFDATVVGQISHLADGSLDLSRLVIPLKDKYSQVQAWCLAIPFLRPADVPRVAADNPYAAGVQTLYQQAFVYACEQRQTGQAIIALGHCYMQDGEDSKESERRIVVGGAEAWSVNLFAPEIAYVALGHLHKAQRVAGHEHIRYSGSPLPMSFTEATYKHQVVCIELEGPVLKHIETIPIPRFVDLLTIPAQPADLASVEQALAQLKLKVDDIDDMKYWPYLAVYLLLEAPEPGLRLRIEAALAGKPVRLAKIEVATTRGTVQEVPLLSLDDLTLLEPMDIFQQLYQQKYADTIPAPLVAAFGELLASG